MDESWPSFFGLLDSDPNRAFELFYDFTWRLFIARPPKVMRSLSKQDREDVITGIILHCWDDDQRVLRTYQDLGRSFAAWLLVVGHNFAVGWIRRRLLHEQRIACEVPSELPDPKDSIDPARDVASRGLLDTILECIARMDPTCRTLLLGSAYELRPRELTGLLGWPKDQNQRAADHLYECRRRLVKLLRQQGIDPTYVESVRQSL